MLRSKLTFHIHQAPLHFIQHHGRYTPWRRGLTCAQDATAATAAPSLAAVVQRLWRSAAEEGALEAALGDMAKQVDDPQVRSGARSVVRHRSVQQPFGWGGFRLQAEKHWAVGWVNGLRVGWVRCILEATMRSARGTKGCYSSCCKLEETL